MLNDVFFRRYQDVAVAKVFDNEIRALFAQAALIINKQLFPTFDWQGKENNQSAAALDRVEAALCMEMGLPMLGTRWFTYNTQWNGNTISQNSKVLISTIIANFLQDTFLETYSVDRYVKFRLSLIELAFRERENIVKGLEAELPRKILQAKLRPVGGSKIRLPGDPADAEKAYAANARKAFQANVEELNTRLRQAGLNLQYHNGFIQGSSDELLSEQLDKPFWEVCGDPKFANIDVEMKEALDRRDNGGRDAAFHAFKALESTIKIISDEKGFTTGSEKGAANYINNLVSAKNGKFIEVWEGEFLTSLFSKLRNPMGHGARSQQTISLDAAQTNWAIETAMTWIKSLIRRM